MTTKISILFIQTLFFFLAITFMVFFAEIIFLTSNGAKFYDESVRWVVEDFTSIRMLLRLGASALYVFYRNRRLFYRQ